MMWHFPMDQVVDGNPVGDINATINGDPRLVNGVRGKAISFNGVDQWADYGIHS